MQIIVPYPPGGSSDVIAREGIAFLRGLSGLNIVAVDVNTVSPPHDVNGMAASLAAALMVETLVLLCRDRAWTATARTEARAGIGLEELR